MRLACVVVLVAALVAAICMPASSVAEELEPEYTNGHDETPVATYQLLGIAPLPEGRMLQLVLVTRNDGVWLLVVLTGPGGQQGAVLQW